MAWLWLESYIRPEEWKDNEAFTIVLSVPANDLGLWILQLSNLDDLTLYPISSPSVSNADGMQDPSMDKLGQGVWDWESQVGKVDRA